MPKPHGRFKPAVHGVALLVAALCLGGTSCPVQGPLYVEDFCWTSFEGLAASDQMPLRLGQYELKNLCDNELGIYLQPLDYPLTYGENNNSFILGPKEKVMVNVWSVQSPTQALISDFQWLRGSSLRLGSFSHEVEAKFLKTGSHHDASAFMVKAMGTLRPNTALDDVRAIGDTLVMPTYGDMFAQDVYGLKAGKKKPNSNPLVPCRRPVSYIEQIGSIDERVPLDPSFRFQADFKGGGVPYPCGEGPNGLTLCPNTPAAEPADGSEYYLIFQVLDDVIPTADPEQYLTYAAVFESDDDDSNDWVPLNQYYWDFFRGTDLWYQAQYVPGTGWTLTASRVTDAENNVAQEVATAARAIISGNTICFAIPASEIAAAVPEYRVTAFAHTGDFGQNFPYDYSSDFAPGVFDLMPIPEPVQ